MNIAGITIQIISQLYIDKGYVQRGSGRFGEGVSRLTRSASKLSKLVVCWFSVSIEIGANEGQNNWMQLLGTILTKTS